MTSEAAPQLLDLTFRGLDRCDGCGVELAPADQLAGLCAACERALAKAPRSKIPRRRERRPLDAAE